MRWDRRDFELSVRRSRIPHDAAGTSDLDDALHVSEQAEDGSACGLRLEGGAVLEVVGHDEVVALGLSRFQCFHGLFGRDVENFVVS